jgi:hypothetical protein
MNVLLFWTMLLFVFWLGALSAKKAHVTAEETAGVGKATVPAGSH